MAEKVNTKHIKKACINGLKDCHSIYLPNIISQSKVNY